MKKTDYPQPLLAIRPHFDSELAVLVAIAVSLLAVPVAAVLAAIVLMLLLAVTGLGVSVPVSMMMTVLLVAGAVIVPPLLYEMRKRAYENSYFYFYEDALRFRFYELWFLERRGRVGYDRIHDVTVESGFLQRQRRLMTVHLFAPGMQLTRAPYHGVKVFDLPRAEDHSGAMIDIISASNRRREDALLQEQLRNYAADQVTAPVSSS